MKHHPTTTWRALFSREARLAAEGFGAERTARQDGQRWARGRFEGAIGEIVRRGCLSSKLLEALLDPSPLLMLRIQTIKTAWASARTGQKLKPATIAQHQAGLESASAALELTLLDLAERPTPSYRDWRRAVA